MAEIKCFKCRFLLYRESCSVITKVHEKSDTKCFTLDNDKLLYLNIDYVPQWIMEKVEESGWTKGKLHCSSCSSKVGSFDFVSGFQCECGETLLPEIHFIKSQIDWKQIL